MPHRRGELGIKTPRNKSIATKTQKVRIFPDLCCFIIFRPSLVKARVYRVKVLRVEPILRYPQGITEFTLSNMWL